MAESDGSTKRCRKCQSFKPWAEFHTDKRAKDGLRSRCKECIRSECRAYVREHADECAVRYKAWRLANPDRIKRKRKVYYAQNRDRISSQVKRRRLANLARIRAVDRARYARTAEAVRKQKAKSSRARYARNRDEIRRKAKAYYAANAAIWKQSRDRYLARRRTASGKYTQADVRQIYQAQGKRCAYCRLSLSRYYEVDHILPLAKGGTNDRSNIQLTCRACNASKRDKHPIDFAQSLGRLL